MIVFFSWYRVLGQQRKASVYCVAFTSQAARPSDGYFKHGKGKGQCESGWCMAWMDRLAGWLVCWLIGARALAACLTVAFVFSWMCAFYIYIYH